jgi:uncharacterized damage-inducible protein DinB
MNRDMLLALYAYNAYANRLVLETAAGLTEDEFTRQSSPSRQSVRTLLAHMIGSEAFFLGLCRGQSLPTPPASPPTLADIQGYASQLPGEQESFLKASDEAGLEREVTFQMGDQTLHLPVWQLLVQAFVHSTHHRGELSIVLSHLGHPLPTLDIIIPFVTWSGQKWPWP